MGCLLWAKDLFHVLPQLLQLWIQYCYIGPHYNDIRLYAFQLITWNYFCKPITTLSDWHTLLHSWFPYPLGECGLVLLHATRQHSPGWCGGQWVHCTPTNEGCFTSDSQCPLEVCVVRKSYFLWGFHAGTLYVCPKTCFGHARGISAWGSHRRGDFRPCIFCEYIFGELAGCWWNSPQGVDIASTRGLLGRLLAECLVMDGQLVIHGRPVCEKLLLGAFGGGNVDPWFVP